MKPVNPVKAGLVLAGVGVTWHVGRVVLVLLGRAEPHVLGSLTFAQTASIVIAGTAATAFLLAYGLAHLWNMWVDSITPRRAISVLLGLAVLVGAGTFAWAMFGRPVDVHVARAERDVAVQVFGLGTVEARVSSQIGFKVSGVLADLRVDVGDRVTKGAVLARLDDREQQAQVARARAAAEQAEANLQRATASVARATATFGNAKRISTRQQTLLKTNSTSVEAAETAQANEDTAAADLNLANSDVLVAKAAISDAKAQQQQQTATLDFHTLAAPYDAMITARQKELGSALNAGQPVFTIIDPKTIWVLAYIDESKAGEIRVGDPAQIVLRSLPSQRFQGHVARIEPESDRVNEERRVEVAFEAIPDDFNLGEQAEVYITTVRLPQTILVPEAAILERSKTEGTVWIVEDGHLQQRQVALGHRLLDGRYEITGDFPNGADVVTQLRAGLRAGRAAKITKAQGSMNLAYRDIKHNRLRFILTCIGLSLLLGVVITITGVYRGLIDDALRQARAANADLWVVQAGTNGPFAEASRIPQDTRNLVARVYGVERAGGVTYQSVQTQLNGKPLRFFLIGYQLDRPGGPPKLVAGRDILRSHYEMIVDRSAGLALDQEVPLGTHGHSFTVVGLTRDNVTNSGDPVAYVTLLDAQELQFELAPPAARREVARGGGLQTSNQINAVIAKVSSYEPTKEVGAALSRWKHLTSLTQEQQETLLSKEVIEKSRRQQLMILVLLVIVAAVIIALIIYTLTLDKTRSIATLKFVGAPDRTIIGMIVQQALAMGLVSFAIGLALILGFQDHFPRRLVILPGDVAVVFAITIAVCLAASTLGIRIALRIDPAEALAAAG